CWPGNITYVNDRALAVTDVLDDIPFGIGTAVAAVRRHARSGPTRIECGPNPLAARIVGDLSICRRCWNLQLVNCCACGSRVANSDRMIGRRCELILRVWPPLPSSSCIRPCKGDLLSAVGMHTKTVKMWRLLSQQKAF